MAKRMTKTAPQRIVAAERADVIIKMRKAGATFKECAAAVGVSIPHAYNVCKHYLDELIKSCTLNREEMRKLECERLNHLLDKLQPRINDGDVNAIAEARKLSESYRRLYGLDEPAKQEVSGPDCGPVKYKLVLPIGLDLTERGDAEE